MHTQVLDPVGDSLAPLLIMCVIVLLQSTAVLSWMVV
jgi:hypothetical protein